MKHIRWLKVVLVGAFLASCTPNGPQPAHRVVIPTIGPVYRGSGGRSDFQLEFSASTNCAEIGESVTFTIHLTNHMSHSVSITGTPPLDIVLRPAQWSSNSPMPITRWSESTEYPLARTNSIVLAAGEARTYQWQWVVAPLYGREDIAGVGAQFAIGRTQQPNGSATPPGSIELGFGVGLTWLTPYDFVHCSEMRR